ncbi:MAG: hypothetical protein KBE23_18135 [Chloroflexi bacterium]|nr:hypothetical protein [Chloroflexota bacterium]
MSRLYFSRLSASGVSGCGLALAATAVYLLRLFHATVDWAAALGQTLDRLRQELSLLDSYVMGSSIAI